MEAPFAIAEVAATNWSFEFIEARLKVVLKSSRQIIIVRLKRDMTNGTWQVPVPREAPTAHKVVSWILSAPKDFLQSLLEITSTVNLLSASLMLPSKNQLFSIINEQKL